MQKAKDNVGIIFHAGAPQGSPYENRLKLSRTTLILFAITVLKSREETIKNLLEEKMHALIRLTIAVTFVCAMLVLTAETKIRTIDRQHVQGG
jgi:integral membrane sensor domain MASE1